MVQSLKPPENESSKMEITVSIPDELAAQLGSLEKQLPEILELGVRHWRTRGQGVYEGAADVLEKLAQLPEPREVLALRPAESLQARIRELLAKNRSVGLDVHEEAEWRQYEYVEHLVRQAKARALLKLKASAPADASR